MMKKSRSRICRRVLCGIFAVLTVLSLSACESEKDKYKSPTKEFFVNDFASVLENSDKETILSYGAALQEKTGAQAVVVTVENLPDEEIADFATELGRNWGVGQKGKDDGIVILLSIEERQVYIAVGYGLEGALPDSKTGRILDNYAVPYFKEDNFSAGLLSVYKAVVNEIYIENGLSADENYIPANDLPIVQKESESNAKAVIISWIIMFVVAFAISIIARKKGIRIYTFPTHFGGPFGGGFGGGGFGGGGGFSGGGGSFGGGGAGRGF